MMSIYDKIMEAELSGPESSIEIDSQIFLDLIDLWIAVGVFISVSKSDDEEVLLDSISKMIDYYALFGDKYAKTE